VILEEWQFSHQSAHTAATCLQLTALQPHFLQERTSNCKQVAREAVTLLHCWDLSTLHITAQQSVCYMHMSSNTTSRHTNLNCSSSILVDYCNRCDRKIDNEYYWRSNTNTTIITTPVNIGSLFNLLPVLNSVIVLQNAHHFPQVLNFILVLACSVYFIIMYGIQLCKFFLVSCKSSDLACMHSILGDVFLCLNLLSC